MTREVTQRVEINGAQLEIRERGSGEPVVFVHGAMGDECAAVVKEPALTEHYRVIDYHRRGWGNSTCPEMPVSIGQQVADCREIMRHLGVERAHMAGQSGGAQIILQLALDAPEAVHSLAVLDVALPSVIFNSSQFGAAAEKAGALYESGDKAGAVEAFAREVGGPDFKAAVAAMDKTLPPGYLERWALAADTLFLSDFQAEWSFTSEDAARVKQPVLNMSGADTQPYFREIHETIRAWLPQAENCKLPDANHAMLQMNPRGAAERLGDFFSRHPIPGY
jgi:pimeloyl-ACP methyl ester carboxylesterase